MMDAHPQSDRGEKSIFHRETHLARIQSMKMHCTRPFSITISENFPILHYFSPGKITRNATYGFDTSDLLRRTPASIYDGLSVKSSSSVLASARRLGGCVWTVEASRAGKVLHTRDKPLVSMLHKVLGLCYVYDVFIVHSGAFRK